MRFLVVDSGPIIRGARIEQMGAERLVTIPEVLSEIRDEQARARLAALPCELEVREPSEEALLAIKRFAKLTGDLPVLSSVDLRVLALAWMLEKQECDGTEHLRTEPLPRGAAAQKLRLQQRAAAAAVSSEPAPAQRELPTFIESSFGSRAESGAAPWGGGKQAQQKQGAQLAAPRPGAAEAAPVAWAEEGAALPGGGAEEEEELALPDAGWAAGLAHELPLSVAAALRRVQQLRPWAQPNPSFLEFEESTPLEGDEHPDSTGDEDPDLPWITPANLRKTQASDARHAGAPKETTRVGCITTDYAMQSVLLQMGLKLLSVDGMLLRSIKQWEHRQLELQFCSKCGNASLVRLAAIVDNRGNQRLLPEKGAPARVRSTNIRGTKYAMPMPKAGRHANNLVLAEDQLLEAQEKSRKQGRKKGHDVFDPDYDVDAHFGRAGKKGAASRVNVKVGYGKKNPNDVRSRPKRT
ncbi:hypothetical protein EMIHUDRAFT_202851 [Emiliania huxleyi CCMP1516]|uniref:20S-pre-rRNA D-site endonuclease NOB1 n=2 Tax=Emiliania huxleyi TaxID=2903 RepID=A0A0D3K8X3_EMIH1|nr:hypothetical protein EMIHUDRAFT_202851 [Emiliania huxleyi CCMP1516]EOD32208.1 hypothetical protein EMIHUDRAFT_202851 [Emiliania huxleyi CCMP1516]|eukprot:XP_005784637.1 hypothetical protein EMIHUDRAFT_202851 [Emiliania huxleyi CCMP1516]